MLKRDTSASNSRESLLGRQLYIGNIPQNIGWKEIKDLMRQAGNVIRVNIIAERNDKTHAIVLFSTAKDARNAISIFNGYKLHGHILDVGEDTSLYGIIKPNDETKGQFQSNYSRNTSSGTIDTISEDHGKRQVFVCNLPYIVGWQDLKDLFREAGTVVRTDIKHDIKTGKSKGMGTVLFSSAKSAELAITMFDGFEWFGRRIEVREDKSYKDQQQKIEEEKCMEELDIQFHNLGVENSSWAERVKTGVSPMKQQFMRRDSDVSLNLEKSPTLSAKDPALISPYASTKARSERIPIVPRKQLDIFGPSLDLSKNPQSLYSSVISPPSRPFYESLSFTSNQNQPQNQRISSSVPDSKLRDIWQQKSTSSKVNNIKFSRIIGTSPGDSTVLGGGSSFGSLSHSTNPWKQT